MRRREMGIRSLARALDAEWVDRTSRSRVGWLGPLVLGLSVTALMGGVFTEPRLLSGSDVAVVLALVLAIHITTSVNGRTGGLVAQQRLVLAVLLLVTVHLAVVGRASAPTGVQVITWLVPASIVAVVASVVSVRSPARARKGVVGYTAVDSAMSVLALMVAAGYLGLYVAFWLNGLPFKVRTGLLWVVVVATALSFLFVRLLEDAAELRRGLRLSLGALVALCLWTAVSQLIVR